MRSLDRGVYRGTILTLKGLGEVLRPGRWSSRSGNACPSGSSRVKCCIMVMRNSSMFCLAKVSPAHTRLPATIAWVSRCFAQRQSEKTIQLKCWMHPIQEARNQTYTFSFSRIAIHSKLYHSYPMLRQSWVPIVCHKLVHTVKFIDNQCGFQTRLGHCGAVGKLKKTS